MSAGGADHVTQEVGEQHSRLSLTRHRAAIEGEADRMAAVRGAFSDRPGVALDELDGLTVTGPEGSWFNVRPSNTEPLLRLNVEAADYESMVNLRDEVLAIIRG